MKTYHVPTLWSDEDGVIAVYEPSAYRTPVNEEGHTLFTLPGSRYFLSCRPDTTMIEAYRLLDAMNAVPVHVITNITEDDPLSKEHTEDKYEWTKKVMPFINMHTQFSVIRIPKHAFASEMLQRKLLPTDILISDYNHDLIPWEEAGGTGIKYLNGINSPDSFDGLKISYEMSSDNIRTFILSAMKEKETHSKEEQRHA